jgi:two-component system C4-dicarboxylate transport sensor histidine kinase DctB
MTRISPRLLGWVAGLLVVTGVSLAVFVGSLAQELDRVLQRADAELALASDRLVTRLRQARELAVLLADHPELRGLDDPARLAMARVLLVKIADRTGAQDLFYADAAGWVITSALDMTGQDVRHDADFSRAMQGALGRSRLTMDGRRLFRHTMPVMAQQGSVIGAIGVVTDAGEIEQTWPAVMPPVFFTDQGGRIFTANRSELLLGHLSDTLSGRDGKRLGVAWGDVAGFDIWVLQPSRYFPTIALHISNPLPVVDLSGEILIDIAPAIQFAATEAAAVGAVLLACLTVLMFIGDRRRALAFANQQLEERVVTRTKELEISNQSLRREIAERQDAEAALQASQHQLVQAGKLNALGQMSAGISHELNQPLMAIRSFAANGVALLDRDRPDTARANLGRITDMTDRMGRIIRALRAFARQEIAPVRRVDLGSVVVGALELTGPMLRQLGVSVHHTPPDVPIWVRAGEVRLSQVFVNLITNAADAMQGGDRRELTISHQTKSDQSGVLPMGPRVTLHDTGPGLLAPEKIFEPFYTTKEVGQNEGMGLGLSITYGIVQSFGGDLRGDNHPDGGAVFTLRLDSWSDPDKSSPIDGDDTPNAAGGGE